MRPAPAAEPRKRWPVPEPRPAPAWPRELDWAFDRGSLPPMSAPRPRAPLHLCAIGLRKLHLLVGFDPAERDRRLAALYRGVDPGPELARVEARLAPARPV